MEKDPMHKDEDPNWDNDQMKDPMEKDPMHKDEDPNWDNDQMKDPMEKDPMHKDDNDYDGTFKPVEQHVEDYGNGQQTDPMQQHQADTGQHKMQQEEDWGNGDPAVKQHTEVEMEPALKHAPDADMGHQEMVTETLAYEAPPEEAITYDEPAQIIEPIEVEAMVEDAPMDDMIED